MDISSFQLLEVLQKLPNPDTSPNRDVCVAILNSSPIRLTVKQQNYPSAFEENHVVLRFRLARNPNWGYPHHPERKFEYMWVIDLKANN